MFAIGLDFAQDLPSECDRHLGRCGRPLTTNPDNSLCGPDDCVPTAPFRSSTVTTGNEPSERAVTLPQCYGRWMNEPPSLSDIVEAFGSTIAFRIAECGTATIHPLPSREATMLAAFPAEANRTTVERRTPRAWPCRSPTAASFGYWGADESVQFHLDWRNVGRRPSGISQGRRLGLTDHHNLRSLRDLRYRNDQTWAFTALVFLM